MVVKMFCANFLILLSFLKFHRSAVAISSYNKCDIKQPSRGILDLKLPSRPARLLNATSAFSLKNCSKSCCDAINCNAYIWRNSEQCFLFQCKVLEDCKVVPYQGTITGFVTRNVALSKEKEHLNEEPVARLVAAQQTVSNIIPIEKENSKTLENKSTVNSNPDLAEQKKKSLASHNASDKEEYLDRGNESKRTSQGQNVTSKISRHKNTTAVKVALTNKKSGSSKNVTASAIPVLNSSLSSQKVTHTTTTSLVAALSFGMVFFITVAVLIGRPWWQSFSVGREGYNRVAFLMNGT